MKFQLLLAGAAALALSFPAYAQDNSVAARGSPSQMTSTKTGGQAANQSTGKTTAQKGKSAKTKKGVAGAQSSTGTNSGPGASTSDRNGGSAASRAPAP